METMNLGITRKLPFSLPLLLAICVAVTLAPSDAMAQRLSIAKGTVNEKGPDVGDRAIDFELPIVKGDGYVSLSDTYKQGPTVLVFLRGFPGYQCPLCTQQVGTLINRSKALAQFAHRIVLVYPGPEDGLDRRAEQFMSGRRLPESMVLIRDDGMKVVDEWGLRWNEKRETGHPATFVLDSYGRIAWKKVSASHAGRSTVEEILKELRKL